MKTRKTNPGRTSFLVFPFPPSHYVGIRSLSPGNWSTQRRRAERHSAATAQSSKPPLSIVRLAAMLAPNPLSPPRPHQPLLSARGAIAVGSSEESSQVLTPCGPEPLGNGGPLFLSAEDFDATGILTGIEPCSSNYWWIPELHRDSDHPTTLVEARSNGTALRAADGPRPAVRGQAARRSSRSSAA